jgi:hypothetical protein
MVPVVLMYCVAVLPLAPVQHVHETEEHGLHELLIHSHSEAHHVHAPAAGHHGLALDDDDRVVLTLDPVFGLPHAIALIAPPVTGAVLYVYAPVASRLAFPPVVEQVTHSPPRAPADLRGPPSPSFL